MLVGYHVRITLVIFKNSIGQTRLWPRTKWPEWTRRRLHWTKFSRPIAAAAPVNTRHQWLLLLLRHRMLLGLL